MRGGASVARGGWYWILSSFDLSNLGKTEPRLGQQLDRSVSTAKLPRGWAGDG